MTKSSVEICASPVKLCVVLKALATSALIPTLPMPKPAAFKEPPSVGDISSDTCVKDVLITRLKAKINI